MATLVGAAAAVPLGYDLFPLDGDEFVDEFVDQSSLLLLDHPPKMAADAPPGPVDERRLCLDPPCSAIDHHPAGSVACDSCCQLSAPASAAASDTARSPFRPDAHSTACDAWVDDDGGGRGSGGDGGTGGGRGSGGGGGSMSPGTTSSLIYTPASSQLGYTASVGDLDGSREGDDDDEDDDNDNDDYDYDAASSPADDRYRVRGRDARSSSCERGHRPPRPPGQTSAIAQPGRLPPALLDSQQQPPPFPPTPSAASGVSAPSLRLTSAAPFSAPAASAAASAAAAAVATAASDFPSPSAPWTVIDPSVHAWMDPPDNSYSAGSAGAPSFTFDDGTGTENPSDDLMSYTDPFANDPGEAFDHQHYQPFRTVNDIGLLAQTQYARDSTYFDEYVDATHPRYVPQASFVPQPVRPAQADPSAVSLVRPSLPFVGREEPIRSFAPRIDVSDAAFEVTPPPPQHQQQQQQHQQQQYFRHHQQQELQLQQQQQQQQQHRNIVNPSLPLGHATSSDMAQPSFQDIGWDPSSLQSSTQQVPSAPSTLPSQREPSTTGTSSPGSATSSRLVAKPDRSPRPSTRSPQPSQQPRGRGGRKRHSRLPEDARQKSSEMRKVAACWRCALQRDPCDKGTPCGRCQMRSQRGQRYYFECDRSKLPDFVHDFLPPSMTLMHQKQTIEDTVNEHVSYWDSKNPIDVYLTSGYGPALRWKVYEFCPKTDEYLGQLQYFQDPTTGITRRIQKYSPPFALMKLDASDDSHFVDYLEQLLSPNHLWDFGRTCFEAETQFDPDAFQANLLQLMCTLFLETDNYDLRSLLKEIIRMILITYIMGHTLTIEENTLYGVLSSIKFSSRPPKPAKHTSPRLANRQLKFFFSVLRNNIYERILKWQQQTLHTSGKKEATWLQSFCAMLGFAMVLEEVQQTIQIQADAKAARNEMSYEQANVEGKNACERIDDRFKFLTGLFQCKYRDRKWSGANGGSFGNGTPRLGDEKANGFLAQLRGLVVEKEHHLQRKSEVEYNPANEVGYTSRLVARFLLPFLKLPA